MNSGKKEKKGLRDGYKVERKEHERKREHTKEWIKKRRKREKEKKEV